jgi:malate synthase
MEDAATAEISRSQVWQWIRSPKGKLEDGRDIDVALFHQVLGEELAKVKEQFGDAGRYEEGAELFGEITASEDFVDFLTLPAYERID